MTPSSTHLVILPTYNTGPRLRGVIEEVLRHWAPVMVVIDGSTDDSAREMKSLAAQHPGLTVLVSPQNRGKGAAVLWGAEAAREKGFTHALVMDADGQHPAESIVEFMAASRRVPAAMILGKPIFPSNIPAERLHGRKLSVGLVHFELMGEAVADPLFGFRIYPIDPLLDVLGARHGGRRYDFDTEAAVRMGWAGVPPVNLCAPVRYFSRAEGGVSHFHYLRDNLTLVWLHTRLITELILFRWFSLLRHRRAWRIAGLVVLLFGMVSAYAADEAVSDSLVKPELRLVTDAPEWKELVTALAHKPDTMAEFTEQRFFPFKRKPVELRGEARVSGARGLSLHYTEPEERIVIFDDQGILLRGAAGEKTPPSDPRAAAANEALRHVLRFDFAALEKDFELYGRRDGAAWQIALVARTDELRRSVGRIEVRGEDTAVRHIEIRRSAKQAIVIDLTGPRSTAAFSADDAKRYFR